VSKRYSPDFKWLVLKLLRYNDSELSDIARFAGIPERTLRDWRRNSSEEAARRRNQVAAAQHPAQRRQSPS
jgi:transposase-like protein